MTKDTLFTCLIALENFPYGKTITNIQLAINEVKEAIMLDYLGQDKAIKNNGGEDRLDYEAK